MKIKNKQLKEFLMDSDLLDKEKVEKAFAEAKEKDIPLGDFLLKEKLISEIELRKLYAYILGRGVDVIKKQKEAFSQSTTDASAARQAKGRSAQGSPSEGTGKPGRNLAKDLRPSSYRRGGREDQV